MNNEIQNEEIDKVLEETKKEIVSSKDIMCGIKKDNVSHKPEIKNEGLPITSEEVESCERATEKDIDEVYNALNSMVFKLKKCIFRVCYINKGQRRFTVQLINEEKN